MSNLQGISHTHIHTLYLTKGGGGGGGEEKEKTYRWQDRQRPSKKNKKIDYQSVDNDFPFIATCSYFFLYWFYF